MNQSTLVDYQERTDAKLRYAEIHLNELQCREPLTGEDFDLAHQESFLFHLLGALESFLFELNECYHLNLYRGKMSIQYFAQQIKKLKVQVSEFDEIIFLTKEKTSWLSQARERRNHPASVSHVQRAWLIDPKTGVLMEKHFGDEFQDWFENMKILLLDLRNRAMLNNP